MNKKTLEERFWSKVDRRTKIECWVWRGAKNLAGYGNIKVEGKYTNAHRISYKIHFGEIKKGLVICHKCDNPTCVNPNHLFSGTPQENDDDKVRKNRSLKGIKHPLAKLNEQNVLEIRKSVGTHQSIADKYNVSRRLIGMVKQKTIWTHL